MWAYKSDEPKVIKEFFCTTHEDVGWILFKPQLVWPAEDEDRGLDDRNPPVENIDEPTPLPKEPRSELLSMMLVLKPYKSPEPKKKENREDLHSKSPPDAKSEDRRVSSTREAQEMEEEENMDSS
ncbi:e3 ubiquitin-protein ligase ari8 [Hordeum vulgare]|nr:e3 ubiquitin-protein ligase ari8 [Hordeum vulgare]